MTRSFLFALSAVVVLAVAGCGDTGGTTSATGGTTSAAGGTTPAAGGAAPTSDTPADAAYSATEVCAYLEAEIPALEEIGSPVGRHANLAGGLATFFEAHGKPANGAVLDAATKEECPAVRAEVLALIDVDSFSSF